jgi:hypothetical protein
MAPALEEKLVEWWLRVYKCVMKAWHKTLDSLVALVACSI